MVNRMTDAFLNEFYGDIIKPLSFGGAVKNYELEPMGLSVFVSEDKK